MLTPLTIVSEEEMVSVVLIEELVFDQFFLVLQSSVLPQRNLLIPELQGQPYSSLLKHLL
jgi:hypothetical protein